MSGPIECQRCGACCRIEGIVRLTDADVGRMAALLSVDEDAFIEQWTDISPDRRGLVLKDAADGSCIMLDAENRCRVYAVRPEKCRTFPHEWMNPESMSYCPYCRELFKKEQP